MRYVEERVRSTLHSVNISFSLNSLSTVKNHTNNGTCITFMDVVNSIPERV